MSGLSQEAMRAAAQAVLDASAAASDAVAAATPTAASTAASMVSAAPVTTATIAATAPAAAPAAATTAPTAAAAAPATASAAARNWHRFTELWSNASRNAPNRWDTPVWKGETTVSDALRAAGGGIATGSKWLYQHALQPTYRYALLPTAKWGARQVAKLPWVYKTALPWIVRGITEAPVIVAGVPESFRRVYRRATQDEQLNPNELTRYSPEAHQEAVDAGRPSRAYAQSNKPTDNHGAIRFFHDVYDQYDRYQAERTLREAYAAARLADKLEAIDHDIRYGREIPEYRWEKRKGHNGQQSVRVVSGRSVESPSPEWVEAAIKKAHHEYNAIIQAGPRTVSRSEDFGSMLADSATGPFGHVLAPIIQNRNALDFNRAMLRSPLVYPHEGQSAPPKGQSDDVLDLLAKNDKMTREDEARMIRGQMANMVGYEGGDRWYERATATNTPVDAYLEAFARLEKAQMGLNSVRDYRGKSARVAMRDVNELMDKLETDPRAFDDAAYESLKTLGEAARAVRMLNPDNKPRLAPGQVPVDAEERRVTAAYGAYDRAFSDKNIGRIGALMDTPMGKEAWIRLVKEAPDAADALSGLGIVGSPGRARDNGALGTQVNVIDSGADAMKTKARKR